jgi:hypothetical protein
MITFLISKSNKSSAELSGDLAYCCKTGDGTEKIKFGDLFTQASSGGISPITAFTKSCVVALKSFICLSGSGGL